MREDRRVRRTRRALVEAFNYLVLNRRERHIRVADVVAQAEVGRSTFYEHYGSIERLHLEALKWPFGAVADAASGKGDEAALTFILEHFWDQRHRARSTLTGAAGEKAQRLLVEMVEERIAGLALSVPTRLAAQQLAGVALGPIRSWLLGEATCRADALAASICAGGGALAHALCCPQETRP